MSSHGVVVYEGHQPSFGCFSRSCDDPFDEQFRFEECLIFVIVLALVGVGWSGEFVCWGVNLPRDMFDYEVVLL